MSKKLIDAASKYAKAHKTFVAFVNENSSKGNLIPRFGDTPEWKPFEKARDNLLSVAISINENESN